MMKKGQDLLAPVHNDLSLNITGESLEGYNLFADSSIENGRELIDGLYENEIKKTSEMGHFKILKHRDVLHGITIKKTGDSSSKLQRDRREKPADPFTKSRGPSSNYFLEDRVVSPPIKEPVWYSATGCQAVETKKLITIQNHFYKEPESSRKSEISPSKKTGTNADLTTPRNSVPLTLNQKDISEKPGDKNSSIKVNSPFKTKNLHEFANICQLVRQNLSKIQGAGSTSSREPSLGRQSHQRVESKSFKKPSIDGLQGPHLTSNPLSIESRQLHNYNHHNILVKNLHLHETKLRSSNPAKHISLSSRKPPSDHSNHTQSASKHVLEGKFESEIKKIKTNLDKMIERASRSIERTSLVSKSEKQLSSMMRCDKDEGKKKTGVGIGRSTLEYYQQSSSSIALLHKKLLASKEDHQVSDDAKKRRSCAGIKLMLSHNSASKVKNTSTDHLNPSFYTGTVDGVTSRQSQSRSKRNSRESSTKIATSTAELGIKGLDSNVIKLLSDKYLSKGSNIKYSGERNPPQSMSSQGKKIEYSEISNLVAKAKQVLQKNKKVTS